MAIAGEPQLGPLPGSDRFDRLELLGAGGMGRVYRAYDRERDAEVALKLLTRSSPGGLLRFKGEFRALADVAHRNLVTLHELYAVGDAWCFTMELVSGVDMLAHVRGPGAVPVEPVTITARDESSQWTLPPAGTAATGSGATGAGDGSLSTPVRFAPLSEQAQFERLRGALGQLVHGVLALHGAGHLHRDLKPSNTMVTADARLVVLDFGIALAIAEAERSVATAATRVGTPAYMAPEQASGAQVSEASDWYAVGVMLFEALTGQRPFHASSVSELLAVKRTVRAPDPAELAPSAPPDLLDLSRRLLRTQPDARPSGAQIAAALNVVVEPARSPLRLPTHAVPVFVGRAAELEDLTRAFRSSRGELRITRVAGPSGSGKSALAEAFLGPLRQDDEVLVLSGRCYQQESVPYKALDSLVDDLAGFLLARDGARTAESLPASFGALVGLFPVLGRLGVPRTTPAADPYEQWRRVVTALRDLFESLGRDTQLVIYIDDVQWGDRESAILLADVLAEPSPPLLLLLTHRGDEGPSDFLRVLRKRGVESSQIDVAPLDGGHARDLALRLLENTRSERAEAERVAERIVSEAGGNAFFLGALARRWRQQQRALGSAPAASGQEVRLDDLLRQQWAELPDGARTLMSIVAVAGQPLPASIAKEAAGLGPDWQNAETLLRKQGLVQSRRLRGHDALVPQHDRIRESIADALDGDARARLHGRLATSLEAAGAGDPETLASHFQLAGHTDKAGLYTARAARAAAASLAFGRAADLFGRALALCDWSGDDRTELALGLADALANSGHGSDAAEAYRRAAEGAPQDIALLCARREAEEYLKAGRLELGTQALARSLQAVGVKLPRATLPWLLWGRARLRMRGVEPRPNTAADPVASLRTDATWIATATLAFANPLMGMGFCAYHLLHALDTGDELRLARAYMAESGYLGVHGARTRERTLAMLERVDALAERVADPYSLAFARQCRAVFHYYVFDFERARVLADRATQGFRENCTGVLWELTTSQMFAVWARYYGGRLAELCEGVPELLREARDLGNRYAVANLDCGVPAVRWLVADDLEGARAAREAAMAPWPESLGFMVFHFYAMTSEVNELLYAGEGYGAWQVVRAAIKPARKSHLLNVALPRVETQLARGRAAVAAAEQASEPARERHMLREARRAARARERALDPWGASAAKLIRAGIARLTGNHDAAYELLRVAAEELDARDTHLFARAARYWIQRRDGAGTMPGAAEKWMRDEGVVNPERFAAMLVPGFRS